MTGALGRIHCTAEPKNMTNDEYILEEALANSHRYKAESLLSKTGVGYLRPATPEERRPEEIRSEALIAKVKQRAAVAASKQKDGTNHPKERP